MLEKNEGYIKKNFDHYKDVLCLVTDNEDPIPKLEKERDTLLTDEQKEKIKDGDVFKQAIK